MNSLKTKLTINEAFEIMKLIKILHFKSFELLNTNDYLHYYNVKTLLYKCLLKIRTAKLSHSDKCNIVFTVNEFESVKFIVKLVTDFQSQYHNVFMNSVLFDLQKQIETYNHIEFNTNIPREQQSIY